MLAVANFSISTWVVLISGETNTEDMSHRWIISIEAQEEISTKRNDAF